MDLGVVDPALTSDLEDYRSLHVAFAEARLAGDTGRRLASRHHDRGADRNARPPTDATWRGRASARFGSWDAALSEAGLPPQARGVWWTAERIIAALQGDARRRGRTPTMREWTANPLGHGQ
jgi:hypothetical protein